MAFREVRVFEVREVLRLWLAGEGFRSMERLSQVDRKTVRRYVDAAERLGLVRDGGEDQLTDVFIGLVVEAVRPHRSDGHGEAWRLLVAHHDADRGWVEDDLTGVKIHELLERRGRGGAVAHGAALRAGGVRPQPRVGARRCGSPTASRATSCRSTSVGWACSFDPAAGRRPGGAGVDLHGLLLAGTASCG